MNALRLAATGLVLNGTPCVFLQGKGAGPVLACRHAVVPTPCTSSNDRDSSVPSTDHQGQVSNVWVSRADRRRGALPVSVFDVSGVVQQPAAFHDPKLVDAPDPVPCRCLDSGISRLCCLRIGCGGHVVRHLGLVHIPVGATTSFMAANRSFSSIFHDWCWSTSVRQRKTSLRT